METPRWVERSLTSRRRRTGGDIEAFAWVVTKEQVGSAPDNEMHGKELSQADESSPDDHFKLNYMPINTESGRRLARR